MSSKKFKKNRNNNARKNRQLNREGLGALQKCRFFVYLIFVFDILMMFYAPIAHLFGATETQILYAIMLMIGAQAIVGSMHIVKYMTTVEIFLSGREKDYANMYASRARFCVLLQFFMIALAIINHVKFDSGIVNTLLSVAGVTLVVLALQNITILQRNYI